MAAIMKSNVRQPHPPTTHGIALFFAGGALIGAGGGETGGCAGLDGGLVGGKFGGTGFDGSFICD
jgi:hypothetical protein